jgi:hypothetical protein
MAMNSRRSSWLLAAVHAAALLSGAKSFRDNPILANAALNRAGLHVLRCALLRPWPQPVGVGWHTC